MTIDMRLWRWVAVGIALVLALAWTPRDAQATPLSRELRAVLQQAPPGAKVITRPACNGRAKA
jgi:hypothetical protein